MFTREEQNLIIDIQSELLRIHSLGLLEKILIDRTTKSAILWATDAYREYGENYRRDKEITEQLITWNNSKIIKSRVRKELGQQSERTRQRGEVFTLLWVCEMMINYVDEGVNVQNANWKKYVDRHHIW